MECPCAGFISFRKVFYLWLSSLLASPSTHIQPLFLSLWQVQELKWTGSHCAWDYNVMPSWWHDLIAMTGETILKQHTNLLLQHDQLGAEASKLLTQRQETQSYLQREHTHKKGKKTTTNQTQSIQIKPPIDNIINLLKEYIWIK